MRLRGVIGIVGGGGLLLLTGCTPASNLSLFGTPTSTRKGGTTATHHSRVPKNGSKSRTSTSKGSTSSQSSPPSNSQSQQPAPQLSERKVKEVKICNKSGQMLILGLGKELPNGSCLEVYKSTRYNLYKMLIETHYRVQYRLHFLPDQGAVQIDIVSAEPIPAVATKLASSSKPTSAAEEGERKKHHREKRKTILPFFYW